jgi:hypothetical protein
MSYANPFNEEVESKTAADGWHASPQWAEVQGNGCIEVQSEASKYRVETCSKQEANAPALAPPESQN